MTFDNKSWEVELVAQNCGYKTRALLKLTGHLRGLILNAYALEPSALTIVMTVESETKYSYSKGPK